MSFRLVGSLTTLKIIPHPNYLVSFDLVRRLKYIFENKLFIKILYIILI